MELTQQKFKKTEVGLIPEDWEVISLSEAVEFLDNKRKPIKSNQRVFGEYPYYGASGIIDYVNDYIFDDELILLGEDGENILSRSLPLAFIVKGKVWVNNHAHVMKPNKDFNIYFLTGFLESLDYSLLNSGTAQPKLNKQSCLNIKIPKPTLLEQKAIANALSDVDTLINDLDTLIEKKKAIKKGAMQQLLTPPHKGGKQLPGFSGEWEEKTLEEVANIKTGSKNNQDKEENGRYPFFVRSQTIERINTYSYDCEAILVPGEGRIGSIYHYIHGKFEVHQRVYKISNFNEEISGKYVYLKMLNGFHDHAMTNSVKATVDSLRLPTFKKFEVDFPPSKEEQESIVFCIDSIEDTIVSLEKKKEKYQKIKQGMMQELLTGKTRLV